jgi:FtsP/CotA-like multicopper oxidase with cupredoxin domain
MVEIEAAGGPLKGLLNNSSFENPVTEDPKLGSTEVWQIINLTPDTHPIHLHLVQFQIISRQSFDADGYMEDYKTENPGLIPYKWTNHDLLGGRGPGTILDPSKYLKGHSVLPPPFEAGWKDTARMNPEEVTRILARFSPRSGGDWAFDATAGPGYVWHCHILEHEDNDMMRPFRVVPWMGEPASASGPGAGQ